MFEPHRNPERCYVVEVSRKGVLMECPRTLRIGTVFQVAFAYNRGVNETRLFRRWTRVARRTANSIAVVFIDPPPDFGNSRQSAPS